MVFLAQDIHRQPRFPEHFWHHETCFLNRQKYWRGKGERHDYSLRCLLFPHKVCQIGLKHSCLLVLSLSYRVGAVLCFGRSILHCCLTFIATSLQLFVSYRSVIYLGMIALL